jgi:rare lipoprotein A
MKNILALIFIFISIINGFAQDTIKGNASYYSESFKGRRTASGEIFSNEKLTAAHKNLPFGTRVKVTNLNNGKSVVVTINDRLPGKSTRVIDLSQKAAKAIGMIRSGVVPVRLEVLSE